MRLAPALALLFPTPIDGVVRPPLDAPVYDLWFHDTDPLRIAFALNNLPRAETLVEAPDSTNEMLLSAPACDGKPLRQEGPERWLKPAGCATIGWSVRVPELDTLAFDATRPAPFWNGRNQLWLLTGNLPWMRYRNQPAATVRIHAKMRGEAIYREAELRSAGAPLHILLGKPSRLYSAGSVTISAYGDVPSGARAERLQRVLAATLSRWRHDILPDDAAPQKQFNYAWVQGAGEAGVFASSGSDAILMQFVPDRRSAHPFAKLEASILLTGAHEGFHSLAASLPGAGPAWLNESLASFFAYEAARNALTGVPLKLARDLVDAPAEQSVLHAQELLDKGNSSGYETIYAGGARFWAAIDKVLTIEPNRSGKLAALIKRTRGMPGVDWSNADAIASYLDRYTDKRAGPIVSCYLVESRCRGATGSRPRDLPAGWTAAPRS